MTILIVYATRYGSTGEVAQKLSEILQKHGYDVDLQPAGKAGDLSRYQAVVLGAPLYIGSWLTEARQFLSDHQTSLSGRPVAIFALGPLHREEKELQGAHDQLGKELAKFPWLKPAALQVFAGKYDPDKLHFLDKIVSRLPGSPLYQAQACDSRDWEKIEGWADNLARLFRQPA